MKIKSIIAVIVVAFAIYGFSVYNQSNEAPQKGNVGIRVGQTAPEISLKNIKGKTMNLSDFRGKMVLVDFWASWCPPCRRENPFVAKAYNTYKDKKFKGGKGFVVYSVSLDGGRRGNEQTWRKAVKDDRMNWDTHFLGNNDIAKKYGIRSIPTNFLLDANGVIIAVNLRQDQLENKLKSLLK